MEKDTLFLWAAAVALVAPSMLAAQSAAAWPMFNRDLGGTR